MQMSKYAPHMVADSKAQMNKFLYGVPDLVKIERRNEMLWKILTSLGSSFMLIKLRDISLGNRLRIIKNLEKVTMSILNRNQVVEVLIIL